MKAEQHILAFLMRYHRWENFVSINQWKWILYQAAMTNLDR